MQKIILFLPCIFLNIVLPIQRVNAEENNVFFSNVWLNGIDKNIETLGSVDISSIEFTR